MVGQLFVPRLLRRFTNPVALAVLVWTVGEMINAPSNSATNAELSPAAMRGRYQGVFSLSWSFASFLAPIMGAVALQYAGSVALWLGCLVLSGGVAVAHLAAAPSRARRIAALATPAETARSEPVPASR